MYERIVALAVLLSLSVVVLAPHVQPDEPPVPRAVYVVGPGDVVAEFIDATEEPTDLRIDLALVHGPEVQVILAPLEGLTTAQTLDRVYLDTANLTRVEDIRLSGNRSFALTTEPETMYAVVLASTQNFTSNQTDQREIERHQLSSGVQVQLVYPEEQLGRSLFIAYVLMVPGAVLLTMLTIMGGRWKRQG